MIALNPRTIILFICICIVAVECHGGGAKSGGGYGVKSGSAGKLNKSQGAKGFLGEPNAKAQTQTNNGAKPKTGGGFLSAWGIISIIMLVIIGSALIYYTSVFYPLVCAERGKYDVMEMTSL